MNTDKSIHQIFFMKDICSQYVAMHVRKFNQLQSSIEFLQRILNFFQWTCEIIISLGTVVKCLLLSYTYSRVR